MLQLTSVSFLLWVKVSSKVNWLSILKKLYGGKVSWWIYKCVTLFYVYFDIEHGYTFQNPPYNFFKMCNQFYKGLLN